MIVNQGGGGSQKAPVISINGSGLVTATAGNKISRRQAIVIESSKQSSKEPWTITTEHEIQGILSLTGSYLKQWEDGDRLREYVRFHANIADPTWQEFDVKVTMADYTLDGREFYYGGAASVTGTISGNTVKIDFEDFFDNHCAFQGDALEAQIIYIPAE